MCVCACVFAGRKAKETEANRQELLESLEAAVKRPREEEDDDVAEGDEAVDSADEESEANIDSDDDDDDGDDDGEEDEDDDGAYGVRPLEALALPSDAQRLR